MKKEKEGIVWTIDDDGRFRCTLVLNETGIVIAEVVAVFAMMIALVRQNIRRKKKKSPRFRACETGGFGMLTAVP